MGANRPLRPDRTLRAGRTVMDGRRGSLRCLRAGSSRSRAGRGSRSRRSSLTGIFLCISVGWRHQPSRVKENKVEEVLFLFFRVLFQVALPEADRSFKLSRHPGRLFGEPDGMGGPPGLRCGL